MNKQATKHKAQKTKHKATVTPRPHKAKGADQRPRIQKIKSRLFAQKDIPLWLVIGYVSRPWTIGLVITALIVQGVLGQREPKTA